MRGQQERRVALAENSCIGVEIAGCGSWGISGGWRGGSGGGAGCGGGEEGSAQYAKRALISF